MLANIVGKSYGQIFREFEGNIDRTVQNSGDVKYTSARMVSSSLRTGSGSRSR